MDTQRAIELEDLIEGLYSERASYLKRIESLQILHNPRAEIDGYVSLISNINDTLMTLAVRAGTQYRH
jgi:hypothetical protein